MNPFVNNQVDYPFTNVPSEEDGFDLEGLFLIAIALLPTLKETLIFKSTRLKSSLPFPSGPVAECCVRACVFRSFVPQSTLFRRSFQPFLLATLMFVIQKLKYLFGRPHPSVVPLFARTTNINFIIVHTTDI